MDTEPMAPGGEVGSDGKELVGLSPKKMYGFSNTEDLVTTEFEGMEASEILSPVEWDDLDPGLSDYQVRISSPVSSIEELHQKRRTLDSIVERFDRIWTYVAGYPLSTIAYGTSLRLLADPGAQYGWTSNSVVAEASIQEEQSLTASIGITNRSWMWLPAPPLAKALAALSTYETLLPHQQELIGLHHQAFRGREQSVRLFFLAKCLEIVSVDLSGTNAKSKEKSLPDAVRKNMKESYSWLYTIANRRREARHIISKGKNSSDLLHDVISPEEYRTFVHDANLIVRVVACQVLDLDEIVLVDGVPPS